MLDLHSKVFFEGIIELLEKKNGRKFQEITTKHCKNCGKEVSIRELKDGHFGLLCRDCYNEYSREYAKCRDNVRKEVYKKRNSYVDMCLSEPCKKTRKKADLSRYVKEPIKKNKVKKVD